jgi:hypothetical protein
LRCLRARRDFCRETGPSGCIHEFRWIMMIDTRAETTCDLFHKRAVVRNCEPLHRRSAGYHGRRLRRPRDVPRLNTPAGGPCPAAVALTAGDTIKLKLNGLCGR